MPFDLKAGIVRILAADGTTTAGTGFVLSEKGIIATCSHVIQAEKLQVRGYPKPERVEVVFRANGQRGSARLLSQAWRSAEAEDFALLQLEGPLPPEVVPLCIGISQGAAGHDFQTFGFPDQSSEEGIYGEGRLLDQTTILAIAVMQVKSSEITPGFSGAPVFDMQTRRVVGMVTSITAPDKFGRLTETAFITPAEAFISVYPELVPSDLRPYMGLSPFTENDAEFFFGRRRLVEGLEEALRARPRFLLVMGPSGSGKSSVVQAGLIPRLRKGSVPGSDLWGIIVARPADRPFDHLERAGLRGAFASLVDAARSWLNRSQGREKLLIVLDQFEEFLVTCPADLRRKFWSALEDLLNSDIEITVLAVMRDDLYSRFADDVPAEVLAWTQRGFFQVSSNLEHEELREIIQEPARHVGLKLEEGLTEVIINDVLESSRDGGARAGRSTVLPLLEFSLSQLWERRDQGLLTHQAYQAIGKVTGSLTAWADQVCRSLEKDGLGPLTRHILTDLVNLGDESESLPSSSRQRRLNDLFFNDAKKDSVFRIVQRLANARLVTTSLDNGEETVQIIHDCLIREWTLLQQWLNEDKKFLKWKRELEKDARQWRYTSPNKISERDEGHLQRGLKLAESEGWLRERGSDLNEAEREFISASQNLKKKELEKEETTRAYRERTRRRIIKGLALFSTISLVLVVFAYLQMEKANEKTEEAIAMSLASQSVQMMDISGSLTESILLAIESLNHKKTLEGEIALRRCLDLQPKRTAKLQHNGSANAAIFSPDGRKIVTASDDRTARIWDVETGEELQRLEHNDSVNVVTISPFGRTIATGSDDRTARIWDAETGDELQRLKHNDSVKAVIFSADGGKIATASDDKTARIWDVRTGKELQKFRHDGSMNSISFSLDGKWIATASDDNTTRIWNVNTGKEIQRLMHSGWVWELLFSIDGKKLAAACSDGMVLLWDIETGKELNKLEHESSIYSMTFSPDGRKIATASDDKTARIWNASTGRELQRLEHDGSVNAVAFSPNGKKIATASRDGTARFWDTETGKELLRLEHDDSVNTVVFSTDGRKMASASDDRTVQLWEVEVDKGLQILEHNASVDAIAFSHDGKRLATASRDNIARLWDVETGKELHCLGHKGCVWGLAFSPDGEKIATASNDKMARIWNSTTGKELWKIQNDGSVNAVAFGQDGQLIATASSDATARLWNVTIAEELKMFKHNDSVGLVVCSPDGREIATGSDNSVYLWNIETGDELKKFEHDDLVNAVIFSPDGKKIAVACDDNAVHLWNVETGEELKRFEHDDSVNAVIFNSDGKKIASASEDKTARLWDIETGIELQRLEHDYSTNAVALSPDGRKIATASKDKIVRVWMLDIESVMETACNQLTKNMTRSEWKRFIKDPDSDCLMCPTEARFNRSNVWPWARKPCQPCIGIID